MKFTIYQELNDSKKRYCVPSEKFKKKGRGFKSLYTFDYDWDGKSIIAHLLYSSKEKEFLSIENKDYIEVFEELKERGYKPATEKQMQKYASDNGLEVVEEPTEEEPVENSEEKED